MNIELYFVPEDEEGILIKRFLKENNIQFKEIMTDDLRILQKVAHFPIQRKVSILEIRYGHHVQAIIGFVERDLNQLIEHIKKYNPKK
ncbi:MAG TPA: hypothetical protein VMZ91_02415 [Candidatus Paceibacterota bacterium]|nr:hypothetical protein [Candidatus Paceibacterota bacterium]